MRSSFDCRIENAKIADWVADEAVWREPLSAANSLIIRENTGNFRDFDPLEAELQPKRSRPLSGFCRNSLLDGTGNYFDGTGIFFEVTGNSIRRTG
jgi:hypothetical protein